jgi:hypothetical protein
MGLALCYFLFIHNHSLYTTNATQGVIGHEKSSEVMHNAVDAYRL